MVDLRVIDILIFRSSGRHCILSTPKVFFFFFFQFCSGPFFPVPAVSRRSHFARVSSMHISHTQYCSPRGVVQTVEIDGANWLSPITFIHLKAPPVGSSLHGAQVPGCSFSTPTSAGARCRVPGRLFPSRCPIGGPAGRLVTASFPPFFVPFRVEPTVQQV